MALLSICSGCSRLYSLLFFLSSLVSHQRLSHYLYLCSYPSRSPTISSSYLFWRSCPLTPASLSPTSLLCVADLTSPSQLLYSRSLFTVRFLARA
ncbi:hypothetical protein BCR37DRAFT_377698 [Protomyces lactucae-debilis]|uniref:Secreted protein n=1 Tax=Protomyces lactucae-debilis TaxID=2754530 RepID=A0A1Y2FLL2_PROLT|nr:uncharacterized protein BCR37DRAFT_377698 [Protomyces lactucae-debilis]ORY84860.1 hypothetical protein BCR37DRAFT_377698 [Protomyces lactucae-debilis]